MKKAFAIAAVLAVSWINAAGQAKVLTSDPLTGLPLIPATVLVKNAGNEPVKMPDGHVCKSKMQGNFYSLYNYFAPNNIDLPEATAWYSSHLSGFKKVQGSESKTSQIAFYNSDGTIVVILTGEDSAKGPNTKTHSAAYERYQPGLSEKTIASLTQGKIVCQ
jgi:hypothetical protein